MLRARKPTRQSVEPQEPDPYSVPEWKRSDQWAEQLGAEPVPLAMNQVGQENPDAWYNAPSWMREDALRKMGYGVPDENAVRLAALKGQAGKDAGSKDLADALAAGDTATSYTPRAGG
jgi:hypothetical protein